MSIRLLTGTCYRSAAHSSGLNLSRVHRLSAERLRVPSLGAFASMTNQIPKTMKAIQVDKLGGPEVNHMVEVPVPEPKDDQVLIKVEYTGVNFIDNYFRTGLYPRALPYIAGQDAVGTLLSLPPNYEAPHNYPSSLPPLKIGQRVMTNAGPSFAEYMAAPIKQVVGIPDFVDSKDGVAMTTTAFTAWGLVSETYKVKQGDWVLIRSVSGGVGTLLAQMCKHAGAKIIGTVSSEAKMQLAKESGVDHVLLSTAPSEVNVKKIMDLTGGEGVRVVYDGVGKDTFEEDFVVVRRLGTLALFGNASGPPPMMSPLKLSPKSLKMSRPKLDPMIETHEEFCSFASHIVKLVEGGHLKFSIHKEYPFTEEGVSQAEIDIASRGTTGKLVIKVA